MTATNRHLVTLVLGLTALLTALLAALLAAFAWPSSEIEPRDLPIGVTGPAPAVAGLQEQLAGRSGADAFDVHRLASRTDAVSAIEDREVYAAFALSPEGSELLTASAASPSVAQLLGQLANQPGEPGAVPPTVTDVVPTASEDPRGAVFASAALPLVLGGIITGAAASVALGRTRDRLVVAALVSVGGGLAMTGVSQSWLGALEGSYVANAGVIALGIAAVALPIVGLRHLLGPAGIGVGTVVVMLVGNPLSGISSAPELIPLGWLGQLLPPGAVGTALRGTSYFDGAGIGLPLLVLTAWALGGLALTLVPRAEAPAAKTEHLTAA